MAHFWPKFGILSSFKVALRKELGLDEEDLPNLPSQSPRETQATICIHQYDDPLVKLIRRRVAFSVMHIERQTRHCQQCGAITIRERPRGGSDADWIDVLEPTTNMH